MDAAPYYNKLNSYPFANKKIQLRTQNLDSAAEISKETGLSDITSRILAARGLLIGKELSDFIEPTLKNGLPLPNLLKGTDIAAKVVRSVIENGGSIAICCDFDVDGLSGGSQLAALFKLLNVPYKVYVPCRFSEGYGLHEHVIRNIKKDGADLVITVDFGTTNTHELTVAKELGLKTIVIDHHHVISVPPCDAFINPHQPECGFAGGILSASGLVWYFILALKSEFGEDSMIDPKSFLDLACLGTICDMVPLIGPNRVIAKRGLELLGRSERVGLKLLSAVAGVKKFPTCVDVGFGLGPRINAAGRMVHGEIVIDLLTTSETETAQSIAQKLDKLNKERQEAEEEVRNLALQAALTQPTPRYSVVVWHPSFHSGVLGIVAQRMVEAFYRPAVILGMDEEGIYKGSVRGIKGINVVKLLESTSKYLIKFGGHEGAGGLSIKAENLVEFAKAFDTQCKKSLESIENHPIIMADTEVNLKDLSLKLITELRSFNPCGVGNPHPILLTKGVKVVSVKELKGGHLKAVLSDGARTYSGLMWRQTSHPELRSGATINLAYRPEINSFSGFDEVQITIQAVEKWVG